MIPAKHFRFVLSFLLGFIVAMNIRFLGDIEIVDSNFNSNNNMNIMMTNIDRPNNNLRNLIQQEKRGNTDDNTNIANTNYKNNVLDGIRILIAITSFDFSQLVYLEEVLESYYDLCVIPNIKQVDIVIYTTQAYPITLIDMWNNRIPSSCKRRRNEKKSASEDEAESVFAVTIIVKPYSLRLFLVDCHRYLFYEKIDDYDLFIYSEDDMIVHPKLIVTYLEETNTVIDLVGLNKSQDFNVGIVRYEYNFPSNIVIDDNTRHATQNVTRVYWEHHPGVKNATGSGEKKKQIIFQKEPKKIFRRRKRRDSWNDAASRRVRDPILNNTHIQMINHHQGMYLVTQHLLKVWKDRPGCDFANVRKHPNIPTQRVWMSSFMMYGYPDSKPGPKACNVQQVLPILNFGSLTVYHLPNKNFRRVGKYQNRTMSDGVTEPTDFDYGDTTNLLISDIQFHVQMIKQQEPNIIPITTIPYNGIRMIDERRLSISENKNKKEKLMHTDSERFDDYYAYVKRGGILSDKDMEHTSLMEGDTLQRQIDKQLKEQQYNRNLNKKEKNQSMKEESGEK